MLEIDYDVKNGWHKPIINPFHHFMIDPRNSSLHYAIQLFEGMKAYRNEQNEVFLFRPEMNMKRMNDSAIRIGLFNFDGEELIKCIEKFLDLEKMWIPEKPMHSIYIRPTYISMTNVLGVHACTEAKIFVLLSPVGPYFKSFKPVSIICSDDNYVRSWKGGFGKYKLGA